MRRILLLALVAVSASLPSIEAAAQQRRPQNTQEDAEAARRRARAKEFENFEAPLPGMANAGPCPYVKVLYDAARYVEFKDNREASAAVAYSGEIEGVNAACAYQGKNPITVDMAVTFSLGKGPQASAGQKDYSYWVAVTTRNREVIAKEWFTIRADFPEGKNSVVVSDRISGITIPRADEKVNGSNFEVLIGFDVTPQMAQFNRDGKRFRVDVGGQAASGTTASQ